MKMTNQLNTKVFKERVSLINWYSLVKESRQNSLDQSLTRVASFAAVFRLVPPHKLWGGTSLKTAAKEAITRGTSYRNEKLCLVKLYVLLRVFLGYVIHSNRLHFTHVEVRRLQRLLHPGSHFTLFCLADSKAFLFMKETSKTEGVHQCGNCFFKDLNRYLFRCYTSCSKRNWKRTNLHKK